MKKGLMLTLFTVALTNFHLFAQTDIKVEITNLTSSEGQLVVLLFDQEEGFPMDGEQAKIQGLVELKDTEPSFTFKNVPTGTYAISAYHDSNENGQIDTNFIGIPKERVGAYKHTKFGRPKFKDCTFDLSGQEDNMKVAITFVN